MALTEENVFQALRGVNDPELHKDIVSLKMLRDVRVSGSSVEITISLTTPSGPVSQVLEQDVSAAVRKLGATDVKVNLIAPTKIATMTQATNEVLPQIKNKIAVGAGKGGVGKSTVSVNLAVGLARRGYKVGLMDGDIYGPSMPTMLGIRGLVPSLIKDPHGSPNNKMVPHHVHGIHAITIGSLVEQDKPLIWRGPMAHGAFKQLLIDNTIWPELDYLIVDLPPGTGDVPLSLCQMLKLTGAVVVATPQQVALDDALRAVRMFQQLGAPMLGMIENMSYMPLPDGSVIDLFGRGGAEKAAGQLGLNFLGALPLYIELRANADSGEPEANFTSRPELKSALEKLVDALVRAVDEQNASGGGPKLEIS